MIARFSSVSKQYFGGEGVSQLSVAIEPGQIIGLLGLNGSGKTTLLKLLCGLLQNDEGEIEITGKNARAARQNVAFMNDRQSFPSWMNEKDVARFMESFYSDFDRIKFFALIDELSVPRKAIGNMSRGERQKLKLVATVARKTKLYLLDEPLSGIDLVARTGILKALLENWDENTSVVLSTHEINDVDPFLDRAIFMSTGTIVADELTETIRASGRSVADRFLELLGGKVS